MVVVQVVSQKTGEPVKGKSVSVGNNAFLASGVSARKTTNANGEAEFTNSKPCQNGEIFIDGRSMYKGKIEGFNRIFI